MPPDVGQHYGPYRVVRALGAGGMGTVWLAEDPRLDRFVAIKTFTGAGNTAHACEQLLHEARAAARLSHPGIAAVHDVLDVAGESAIVFEYVEGDTLASRLLLGPLPLSDALRVGEQLAEGLAAAHSQGVIHSDLKPANVMLLPDGRPKILDFGIAHSTARESAQTSLALISTLHAGTPAYAAPEQWRGEPTGVYTDIFALGVLLFEMLSGRRPFDTRNSNALMHQVLEGPRPRIRAINPQVPARVDALIAQMLKPEPSERPATANDVADILRSAALDLGHTHHVPAALTSVRPLGSRIVLGTRSRVVGMAVALVLVLVVGALLASLRSTDTHSRQPVPVIAVLSLTNTGGIPNDDISRQASQTASRGASHP